MSKHSKSIWWFSLVLILVVSISTAAFAQEVEHLSEPQTNCPIEFEEPTVEYPPEPMTTTCHFDYPLPDLPDPSEEPDMSEFNVSSSYLSLDMVRDFFFHDTETPLLVLSDEVGTWKFGFVIEKENDFLLYLKTIEKDNEMYSSQNKILVHGDVYDELLEMYKNLSQIN